MGIVDLRLLDRLAIEGVGDLLGQDGGQPGFVGAEEEGPAELQPKG